MTTARPPATPDIIAGLPDPPQRDPEDLTSFNHRNATGSARHLMQHLGNPDATIVSGEHYILPEPNAPLVGRRAPGLCIAFNVTGPPMWPATPVSSRRRASRRTSC